MAPRLEEPKTILGANYSQQEQTEVQEACKPIEITDLLDIDSNVINYGQFICGKILGSTMLLSNISNEDQVVTMSISKQK